MRTGDNALADRHQHTGPTPAYIWYVRVWPSVSGWHEVINITADSPYPSISLYGW